MLQCYCQHWTIDAETGAAKFKFESLASKTRAAGWERPRGEFCISHTHEKHVFVAVWLYLEISGLFTSDIWHKFDFTSKFSELHRSRLPSLQCRKQQRQLFSYCCKDSCAAVEQYHVVCRFESLAGKLSKALGCCWRQLYHCRCTLVEWCATGFQLCACVWSKQNLSEQGSPQSIGPLQDSCRGPPSRSVIALLTKWDLPLQLRSASLRRQKIFWK